MNACSHLAVLHESGVMLCVDSVVARDSVGDTRVYAAGAGDTRTLSPLLGWAVSPTNSRAGAGGAALLAPSS